MTDDPQHEQTPTREPEGDAPESPDVSTPVPTPKKRSAREIQMMRNMWIVIGGLSFLLIVSMMTRQPSPRPAPPRASDPEVAAIRAELDMRVTEINRERAEIGKPPLPAVGEGTGQITARLRQDADTLVTLVERYQQLVAEKDRELTEKNIEIIRSAQQRDALAAEIDDARAHPRDDDGAAARLQDELAEALARANRLADDLGEARQRIAELEDSPPGDEIEILTRRLDEAKRARDFFEQRAAQLEAQLENDENDENEGDEGVEGDDDIDNIDGP